MCLVWRAQGVRRDEQLAGDLRPAQLAGEQPQDLELPVAQRVHRGGPVSRSRRRGRRADAIRWARAAADARHVWTSRSNASSQPPSSRKSRRTPLVPAPRPRQRPGSSTAPSRCPCASCASAGASGSRARSRRGPRRLGRVVQPVQQPGPPGRRPPSPGRSRCCAMSRRTSVRWSNSLRYLASSVADTPRSRAQSAASDSLPCRIRILALIAAMGRTSGKKPGRNSSSAWSRSATASSGSPSALGDPSPWPRTTGNAVSVIDNGRRGRRRSRECRLALSSSPTSTSISLIPTCRSTVARAYASPCGFGPLAGRAGRASVPCAGARPRATCRRERTVLLSSSTSVAGGVQARHRLRERLQSARHVAFAQAARPRNPAAPPRARWSSGRARSSARRACAPPCPAMSPRA